MYEELIKSLRTCSKIDTDCIGCLKEGEIIHKFCWLELMSEAATAIEKLQKPQWISVTERLPECEQEVLICTEKKLVGRNAYIDSIVTPAIYEDGTMRENESKWRWEDIDWAGWDEEEDCGIIPEGWWENRHFNPDDVYNNPVDRKVVAWMPLPEPPKEEK